MKHQQRRRARYHCAALVAAWTQLGVGLPAVATVPAASLRVPEGFTVELAAGPPLVDRPIVAAFDDAGYLYVAESSGSNDPVEQQLAERPHRILRLEDVDGDGSFDRRTIFADRMMLPQGAMFLDGSLYVAAPPSIWKLTDADGDGVAEERTPWFSGKTLTACANDLHGPYFGPDGWIYWCKGAFAEQTHQVNGTEWTTRAAHVFRCRVDGTGIEPVITGGMDNPVDVAFTANGEAVLSATYLEGDGRRDGLVHAIYGGVYGRRHGVLEGHRRTGPLMPALELMSPVAPCGLDRYDSDAFGTDFTGELFLCQFNMRKASRHRVRRSGASLVSEERDFLVSEEVDFHPTDVLMDADGSLLVLDTGGWYKLCCPTSQLWKPDVLGGIYRVRRFGARRVDDPRGQRVDWNGSAKQLWLLLGDERPAVRDRARRELALRRDSPDVGALLSELSHGAQSSNWSWLTGDAGGAAQTDSVALSRAWGLIQADSVPSRALVRRILQSPNADARHVALCGVSLHRDAAAAPQLLQILATDEPFNRRVAAEALGRLGHPEFVSPLLAAAGTTDDRALRHAIIYALLDLAEPAALADGLMSKNAGTAAAAMLALDQLDEDRLPSEAVLRGLDSQENLLREAAMLVISRRPQWGDDLAGWAGQELRTTEGEKESAELVSLLSGLARQPAMEQLLEDVLAEDSLPFAKRTTLELMARASGGDLPAGWQQALAALIAQGEPGMLEQALDVAHRGGSDNLAAELVAALLQTADRPQLPVDLRVKALTIVIRRLSELSAPRFELLKDALGEAHSMEVRAMAAEAISSARLGGSQLTELCTAIESVNPLEINRLLIAFDRIDDLGLATRLIEALKGAKSLTSVRMDVVRGVLAKCGETLEPALADLEKLINVDAVEQRARIAQILRHAGEGDVRRGHAVFHSSKAACSTCHRLGHSGGTLGPELTSIGATRTERDLLESILYPSLSFVRGYEPVVAYLVDGRVISGVVKDENAGELLIASAADKEVRLARDDLEDLRPSEVSVMPAGLDKQLSTQELIDLVAFLRNAGRTDGSPE